MASFAVESEYRTLIQRVLDLEKRLSNVNEEVNDLQDFRSLHDDRLNRIENECGIDQPAMK